MPTNRNATDASTAYTQWKNTYVTTNGAGPYRRVLFDDFTATVSEGIAYGMLLAVYHDDQALLDDLWGYYNAHLDPNGLMHWKIGNTYGAIWGQNAATDAEEDAAMALILADCQWGSAGATNYYQDAVDLINKMMQHEVEAGTFVLKPGDVWGGSSITNPSYFAPAYYRYFATVTGDNNWLLVADKCYDILNLAAHPTTGLLPDWCDANGNQTSNGYDYRYDAARVPWRIALDYHWFGIADAATICTDLTNFVISQGGTTSIVDGYQLNGNPIGGNHNNTFVGCFAVGGMATTDQTYVDAAYTDNVSTAANTYFNSTIKALTLLNQTGNFYAPQCQLNTTPPPTPGGSMVNDFTAVIDIDSCTNNRFTVTDTTNFSAGDPILIIQMQGVSIDQNNTASFGSIQAYQSAGNYEFNVIDSIAGNDIFIANTLMNTYDVNGKVQIVRVEQMDDLTVDTELTATAWDGSIGGVLVLDIADSLILNADINMDAKGFRGGVEQGNHSDCGYAEYAVPSGTLQAAEKGEGCHEPVENKELGRAAIANGGGGGTSHNSGGGGGANYGAGGQGGNEWSDCSTPTNNGGLGGNALTYNLFNKLFLGGGGGSGHGNGNQAVEGGAGGGIVIIRANTLIGNGHTISANGESPASGSQDGGSGGGAGGSIVLDIQQAAAGLTLSVEGGDGGDNSNPSTCIGVGGGGGGGLIAFTSVSTPSNVTTQVQGGTSGLHTNNSSSCYNSTNGGTSGSQGGIQYSLTLPTSGIPHNGCDPIACPRDIFEPNESITEAAPLPSVGVLKNASVCPAGDEDWYSFVVHANHPHIRIQLTEMRADFDLQLFDVNGYLIAYSHDIGTELESIDYNYIMPNTYYLRVFGKSDASYPEGYHLRLLRHNIPFTLVPNKNIGNALANEVSIPFTLYPNPATQHCSLRFESAPTQPISIQLFDVYGRSVYQTQTSQTTTILDLHALAKGLYEVEVQTGNQKFTQRLVKQ